MKVRVLGPLEVEGDDGLDVPVGGPKERALLAVLASLAGEVLSEGFLTEALWGDEPPRTAARTLQGYVSRIRKVLDDDGTILASKGSGWVLDLPDGALDLDTVESLVDKARSCTGRADHVGAALAYADALRHWRGRPLDEFADLSWAVLESSRLAELEQLIIEERIDAELACGRHAELVGELEAVCHAHPLRERLWGQRMLALYRAGRQAEALHVYQELRSTLVEELGIEPSPVVSDLERAILAHDPELEATPMPGTDQSEALETQASVPAGNQGMVAVLFTDIVASTELLQRLGDDAYESVRREHFSFLRAAIENLGGAAIKNLGDGMMAVFGRAVDALGCAVAIQQGNARHRRRSADDGLAVRVGVHAGAPVHAEDDYVGTAVVVAKRLCDTAGPDRILVSRLVADLVGSRGGFEVTELKPIGVKGITRPIAACEVTWEEQGPRPLPGPVVSLREDGFVGRHAESAVLTAAWQQAQTGRAEVVFVAGEPGIGKTALALKSAEHAWTQGAIVMYGRCDEETLIPFQPVVEALTHYVETTPADQLRRQLGARTADLSLLLPALRLRLPEVESMEGTGEETERYRIFEAVVTLLRAAGADAPVVLVLDDLHWADRTTLRLVHHLIRSSGDIALLLIGTYRDTDLVRTHPMAETLADLRRNELVDRIMLRGLDAADVLRMLVGDAAPDEHDERLATVIFEETEGSPLFLRETVRHLAESGGIERDDVGRWRVTRRIEQLGVPEGVREVIGRRLTGLPEDANTALRVGSVMGREVRLDVLEHVTELSEEDLLDGLDAATAAGIVGEEPASAGRWSFTHAMVRQALYEELSLTRRVRLHQNVGEALEAIDGTDDGPHLAPLAYHFTQAAVGGNAEKAIDYARRAGEHARRQSAHDDAVRHFAAALEVAEDAGTDVGTRADLLLSQGEAEWVSSGPRAARSTFERAVALIGTDDPDRLARAAFGYAGLLLYWVNLDVEPRTVELLELALGALPDGDSRSRAMVLASLAQALHFEPGTEARRAALADEAVEMSRALGDPTLVGWTLAAKNLATIGPDTAATCASTSEEITLLARQAGDRRLELIGLLHQAMFLRSRDAVDEVAAAAAMARTLADELHDPTARMICTAFSGMSATVEGRFDDAEQAFNDAFAIGQEARNPLAFAVYGAGIGPVRWFQGRVAEAVGWILEYREAFRGLDAAVGAISVLALAETGAHDQAAALAEDLDAGNERTFPRNVGFLYGAGALSRAAVDLDDSRLAAALYDVQLPYIDGMTSLANGGIGPVEAYLGCCALAQGRLDVAEDHLTSSIEFCDSHGWRAIGVELRYLLAMTLDRAQRAGDSERLMRLLDSVIDEGTAIGMWGRVRDATSMRDRRRGDATVDRTERVRVSWRDRARGAMTRRGRAAVAAWTRGQTDDELLRRFSSQRAQQTLFTAMARSFQPSMSFGLDGDIEVELRMPDHLGEPEASDWWTLQIHQDRAESTRGRSADAQVTIRADLPAFVRIAAGELDVAGAIETWQVDLEGDVSLAARVPDLFGAVPPMELRPPVTPT